MINTIMKTIKNFITNLLIFLVASLYILYILYIRLIMERLPRIFFIELTANQILITLFIIGCLCIRIYGMLKKYKVIKEKEKKYFLIVWLLNVLGWISKKYNSIWINFHRMFVAKYLKVHNLLIKFTKFLWKQREEYDRFELFIVLLFRVLPRIIVVTAFWVDILVYQEFNFYYKTLWLLLLPLIYTAIYSMLEQFYLDNMNYFNEYLLQFCIRDHEDADCFQISFKFIEGYRPQNITNMQDFMLNHYYPIYNINTILATYEAFMIYYKLNWLLIVILVLHVIGWITILIMGIM